eukprot:3941068-Rhodomonas_salina.2
MPLHFAYACCVRCAVLTQRIAGQRFLRRASDFSTCIRHGYHHPPRAMSSTEREYAATRLVRDV